MTENNIDNYGYWSGATNFSLKTRSDGGENTESRHLVKKQLKENERYKLYHRTI